MKANYLDMGRRRRMAKDMAKDYLLREGRAQCEKCLAELNRQCVTTSKYNAMFHVMHMLVVLHDKYGFGRKRLEELLSEYAARDESFKEDLSDGVAWTKTKRRLEEIGLRFSEEDDELCSKVELLFEKDVTRYEKEKKRR